jgi:hypothetical protein
MLSWPTQFDVVLCKSIDSQPTFKSLHVNANIIPSTSLEATGFVIVIFGVAVLKKVPSINIVIVQYVQEPVNRDADATEAVRHHRHESSR